MTTKIGLLPHIESVVAALAMEDSHLKGRQRWLAYEAAKRRMSELCGNRAPEENRNYEQYELAMKQYLNLVQL